MGLFVKGLSTTVSFWLGRFRPQVAGSDRPLTMITERRNACSNSCRWLWPCCSRRAVESGMATPTIQMKEWEDQIRERPPVPLRMVERFVNAAPIAGIVHQDHRGNRCPAEDIERHQPTGAWRVNRGRHGGVHDLSGNEGTSLARAKKGAKRSGRKGKCDFRDKRSGTAADERSAVWLQVTMGK